MSRKNGCSYTLHTLDFNSLCKLEVLSIKFYGHRMLTLGKPLRKLFLNMVFNADKVY